GLESLPFMESTRLPRRPSCLLGHPRITFVLPFPLSFFLALYSFQGAIARSESVLDYSIKRIWIMQALFDLFLKFF
ncbi:MAG TPA: hypothetical protein VN540_06570, partial [Clostridia bacterium]|nr:hypothetical protein [Clostridia bacterium]